MRDRFTRVLKAISPSRARCSRTHLRSQLDSFARTHLVGAGLDSITAPARRRQLSVVHEGPARIANSAPRPDAGMILSNEPGYYKSGHYGIRIENLVLGHRGAGRRRRGEALNRF